MFICWRLDLLAGFASLEPSDVFLAEMTDIPTRIAMTIKLSAATSILLKCRRAGRSPILASELIMKAGMPLPRPGAIQAEYRLLSRKRANSALFMFWKGSQFLNQKLRLGSALQSEPLSSSPWTCGSGLGLTPPKTKSTVG
jgi:hypothetical protein